MPRTDASATRGKLRAASQVHAEAISIIALREVLRSITDYDTPEGIRQRIRDLVAVKSTAMGLDAQNFDAKLEESAELIAQVDQAIQKAVREHGGE